MIIERAFPDRDTAEKFARELLQTHDCITVEMSDQGKEVDTFPARHQANLYPERITGPIYATFWAGEGDVFTDEQIALIYKVTT